jgi:hypothetical protein
MLQVKVEERLQRSSSVEKVHGIALSVPKCVMYSCIFPASSVPPDFSLRHVAAQTISALLAAAGIGDTAKVQAITSLKEANINSSECKRLVSFVHVICPVPRCNGVAVRLTLRAPAQVI